MFKERESYQSVFIVIRHITSSLHGSDSIEYRIDERSSASGEVSSSYLCQEGLLVSLSCTDECDMPTTIALGECYTRDHRHDRLTIYTSIAHDGGGVSEDEHHLLWRKRCDQGRIPTHEIAIRIIVVSLLEESGDEIFSDAAIETVIIAFTQCLTIDESRE